MQLPLNLDLATMQQKWKSVLDPVIAGSANPQLVIGQAQLAFGSTTSTVFVTIPQSPLVQINVQEPGTFEVSGVFHTENTVAGQNCFLQIACIQGTVQMLRNSPTMQGQSSATANGCSTSPYLLCTITQPGTYIFALQLKVSAGTCDLRNDVFKEGQALIIKEIPNG